MLWVAILQKAILLAAMMMATAPEIIRATMLQMACSFTLSSFIKMVRGVMEKLAQKKPKKAYRESATNCGSLL